MQTSGRITKSSLTPPQARLVELMQRLNFGRIEDLHVRNGEPQFTPPTVYPPQQPDLVGWAL
ncbi:MAG TPA: hypothetical protein P5169_07450 [Kiritimatiellia bacterium]|nr:hypothetical protein [Kiritimatiellia bacterium]